MKFLKDRIPNIFLRNIILAIALLILLFIIISFGLKIYTHHGQAYSVPDFKGLTIPEAKQIIEDKGYRYQVIDSVFINDMKRGVIVDQNPPADFKVKTNRTIFFTINAFTKPKVEMPNIVGVSLRQAKTILETRGLFVGKLLYVADFAKNNVLKQKYEGSEIQTNTLVDKGSFIDVVIGNGLSSQSTYVPDLFLHEKNKALQEITNHYLNIGAVIYDESVKDFKDSLNAAVFKQHPTYSEKKRIRLGSFIDIWLTVDSTKLFTDTLLIQTNYFDE
ncbi:MAG: PASTA domain-containing protein [Bacteroidetes bacterium]|nr:PASTA domain-containing protein [Bacteroidota bacterium]